MSAATLADRLEEVEERLARACQKAGRRREDVLLLAVSKVFPAEAIEEAHALGLREFGENYVQEFEAKAPQVKNLPGARFHFIGHLQSNKSRRATGLFDVVQTVDTPKLARRLHESLNEESAAKSLDIFLEVKLSEEESKHGCAPQDLPALIDAVRALPNLRLRGLMTMPPWNEDPETARPYFQRLHQLAEQHQLTELSMGMSNDLEVAVEEGSTLVRIGTALFGSRKPYLQ